MAKYEYLSNLDILDYIDNLQVKVQYVKIIILDKDDRPIQAIEGRCTNGSININGSSSVRRTGSLTLIADPDNDVDIMHQVTKIDTLISMNKRVSIEIGIKNSEFKYTNYDIFWFPMGIFIISNASVTNNNSGISISLKLDDKMSLLNGTNGGILMSAIIHSPKRETVNGDVVENFPKIRDIIKTLLIEFGQLNENQIVIEDIPSRIANVVRWTGKQNLYIDYGRKIVTFEKIDDPNYKEFTFNSPIGYENTDFLYPGKLSSNLGETITSVLDKIKNTLGNFEYFFDIDGVFHFQGIKNYLNEGSAIDDLGEAINEKYFINTSGGRSVYSFTDSSFVVSYGNNPQYNRIKNDLSVWGEITNNKDAIRYHLVIDDLSKFAKSQTTENGKVVYRFNKYAYTTYTDEYGVVRAESAHEADIGEMGWIPADWRMELYLGIIAGKYTANYAKEFVEEFPKSYDVSPFDSTAGAGWKQDQSSLHYYFDILDVNSLNPQIEVKNFSIDKIGRRGETFSNDKINCVFAPDVENIVFLNSALDSQKLLALEEECMMNGQDYILLSEDIYSNLAKETIYKSAYDYLRSILHERLSYNNNINLTTIPIYHLDVNSRITIENDESDIHGDYVIKTLSIPLDTNGSMTINATKAVERI